MAGFLFDQVVFGPLKSRRMGSSLGVNLLPLTAKCCSFNCIYCECGWTLKKSTASGKFPPVSVVEEALEIKLKALCDEGRGLPDSITFAGNGEPTLHPQFPEIIMITKNLRDKYAPSSRIVVLSNGTTLGNPHVFNALKLADMNIQKLDGGTNETVKTINQPFNKEFDTEALIGNLCRFEGEVIIQTLFLKGILNGKHIDNTSDSEIFAWIENLKKIRPQFVMIYSIDRQTPCGGIQKVPVTVLEHIALRVNSAGVKTRVYS